MGFFSVKILEHNPSSFNMFMKKSDMTHINDVIYVIGNYYTYEYSFKGKNGKMNIEYIHCFLREYINATPGFAPREIRVDQIHNLEKFDMNRNDESNISSRVLKTDNILDTFFK